MKIKISGVIDKVITSGILLIAGLIPIICFNQTTEFYEIPKLIFLIVSVILLTGLWIFSWILKGKIQFTKTPLDFPLILLAIVVLLSTYFSTSRFPAIYGNFPRVHGSAVSWIAYIMLYFVAVSNIKTITNIKKIIYFLYGSAIIASIVSILSFFNIYIPLDFARSASFSLTGSTFSLIAVLLILLPLPLLSLAKNNKFIPLPFGLFISVLFSFTIILIGSMPSYILLFLVFLICSLVLKPYLFKNLKHAIPLFFIPVSVSLITLVLVYIQLPGNIIYKFESNFPREIQLPLDISWKISASAFRDNPLIGTGPSTFLFNFTSYKPLEFNKLPFWNFSFDSPYNEFLLIMGTLGAFGLFIILFIDFIILSIAKENLFSNAGNEDESVHLLNNGLGLSAITAIALFFIHPTTLVSFVITIFIFVLLMVSQKTIREKMIDFSMGLNSSNPSGKNLNLFPFIIFTVYLIVAGLALFETYKATAADYYHRQSLLQANKSGNNTYMMLQKAEELNPWIDLYRIDLAQTNFALANAMAQQKGPTEANPQGTLTDEDKKTIQTLISQSINEARVAVVLSPLSARNWEILASIYRNITGVAQNAITFSLDTYGRAIQRDPLNPTLRLNVGGVYYSIKNYDLAIRFFTDAVNLKPDNANAYFNLSIALRDKGDFKNAKLVADQTVNLLSKNKNGTDYKLAIQLSDDLAKKIENNIETQKDQANSSNNSLSKTDVKISELNNPPEVTTPSAIKRNPTTNLPSLSITPTPKR